MPTSVRADVILSNQNKVGQILKANAQYTGDDVQSTLRTYMALSRSYHNGCVRAVNQNWKYRTDTAALTVAANTNINLLQYATQSRYNNLYHAGGRTSKVEITTAFYSADGLHCADPVM